MADNSLYGGGGNDFIFGNVRDLSFSATDGTVLSGTGHVIGTFAGNLTLPNGQVRVDNGSTLSFGSDTLDGGAGSDFICGDALDLSGLNDFLVKVDTGFVNKNKIIWGDDVLTGGSGADTFAFTLVDDNNDVLLRDGVNDGMQGHDIITDFEVGVDKLQFKGVADLTALNNVTTNFITGLNADGQGDAGDTLITFDGGGSITLYDVTLSAYPANTVFA